jgi:hypothetical protein
MPRLRFLATSTDPRPDHPGTSYGPGHETDYVVEDYDYIKSLLLEGKAELLDGPPPPELFAAPKPEQPAALPEQQPTKA